MVSEVKYRFPMRRTFSWPASESREIWFTRNNARASWRGRHEIKYRTTHTQSRCKLIPRESWHRCSTTEPVNCYSQLSKRNHPLMAGAWNPRQLQTTSSQVFASFTVETLPRRPKSTSRWLEENSHGCQCFKRKRPTEAKAFRHSSCRKPEAFRVPTGPLITTMANTAGNYAFAIFTSV